MKAVLYDQFCGPIRIGEVETPPVPHDGALIAVRATGICRSDWHGWQGHDGDIRTLPHVPGHEFAGEIVSVGTDVQKWKPGDRVTIPFVAGCGSCPECECGNPQVCDHQYQPGFTGWGSFAEYVAVRYADLNLVRLPSELDYVTAASLGCRLATAYRAILLQGKLRSGEWLAVHGCGGVGLSAVMLAKAIGAQVLAIDVRADALELAQSLGAAATIRADQVEDVSAAVHAITKRGAEVSLDALGSRKTCSDSILSLRKRGRHVQVGLLAGADYLPPLPMHRVIAWELELYGSHGLAAKDYSGLLELICSGRMDATRLVGRTISLAEASEVLMTMNNSAPLGVTVVDRF
jgi:alcohol dehydrogenase